MLLLDAGNALAAQEALAQKSQGKVIIEAMNLLHYDAMTIGNLDLEWPLEVLSQRIAEARFPVLSANLVSAADGKLIAQPYVVKQVGGRKAAIIGLTWDQSWSGSQGQYAVLNANETLTKYVAEVSAQADIVIVLSNMGWEEDQSLSTAIPGIDLIVGSRTGIAIDEAWRNPQTGTLVVQAAYHGQRIGWRTLQIDEAGGITHYQDELVLLTEDIADDPEMRAFLDSYPLR